MYTLQTINKSSSRRLFSNRISSSKISYINKPSHIKSNTCTSNKTSTCTSYNPSKLEDSVYYTHIRKSASPRKTYEIHSVHPTYENMNKSKLNINMKINTPHTRIPCTISSSPRYHPITVSHYCSDIYSLNNNFKSFRNHIHENFSSSNNNNKINNNNLSIVKEEHSIPRRTLSSIGKPIEQLDNSTNYELFNEDTEAYK